MSLVRKIIFVAPVLLLLGCGTLDKKTNLLNIGDSKEAVLSIMGNPAKRQHKGEQEVWQYCVSGSSVGENDHKDIMFYQGKLSSIDSYKSNITGCTNAIRQAIAWRPESVSVAKQLPREEFSIEKAKTICKEFGFKSGSEGMANCLLTQQARYDAETNRQKEMEANAQWASEQQALEAERLNQQQIYQQNQIQAEMLRDIQERGEESRRQQMELFKPKPVIKTDCKSDNLGGVHCETR